MAKPFSFSLRPELVDVLDALAFLEGVPPTTYLREQASKHLESRSADETVEQALKQRAVHRAKKEGKLRSIHPDTEQGAS